MSAACSSQSQPVWGCLRAAWVEHCARVAEFVARVLLLQLSCSDCLQKRGKGSQQAHDILESGLNQAATSTSAAMDRVAAESKKAVDKLGAAGKLCGAHLSCCGLPKPELEPVLLQLFYAVSI